MKRSKFNLSNYKLCSMDMGYLVPIGWHETLPGDTIQHATNCLIRAAPLLSPVMHPINVRIHHFFVPNRLLWDNWESFITGGADGNNASEHPKRNIGTATSAGSLADYLGIPLESNNQDVSVLPYRAYGLIWNEFFRDQDLQSEVTVQKGDGSDTGTNNALLRVAWQKDYFTMARPWAQKGDDVTLPLGTTAPVVAPTGLISSPFMRNSTDDSLNTNMTNLTTSGIGSWNDQGSTPVYMDPNNTLVADLSNASAVTVNVLREALALQRYKEARARFGSRYTEYLAYLGVKSSDSRLQRPEYLGGGTQNIQFSEVLATSESGAAKVGDMKGHGIASMRSNRYRRYFEEHGIVMSLMSVLPKTIYQQGIERKWARTTKEHYWQKELEHVGQQEALQSEIFAATTTPDATFGYTDRYDEYRKIWSSTAGDFRKTLNYWHLAREFGSDPVLNASFIEADPTKRVFASTSEPTLYVMAKHSIQARRQLSKQAHAFIK